MVGSLVTLPGYLAARLEIAVHSGTTVRLVVGRLAAAVLVVDCLGTVVRLDSLVHPLVKVDYCFVGLADLALAADARSLALVVR